MKASECSNGDVEVLWVDLYL